MVWRRCGVSVIFFLSGPAPTEIYPLALRDALPISPVQRRHTTPSTPPIPGHSTAAPSTAAPLPSPLPTAPCSAALPSSSSITPLPAPCQHIMPSSARAAPRPRVLLHSTTEPCGELQRQAGDTVCPLTVYYCYACRSAASTTTPHDPPPHPNTPPAAHTTQAVPNLHRNQPTPSYQHPTRPPLTQSP